MIYILLLALGIDLTIWFVEGHFGWPVESFAIALILLLNAGLGVYQESKAENALARLKALAESFVWIIRDGVVVHRPSAEIVPGDVVRVEAGDRVPADGNLVDVHGVMVDESVLTGESLPIEKATGTELFSGTLLTRGPTTTAPASWLATAHRVCAGLASFAGIGIARHIWICLGGGCCLVELGRC